MATWRPSLAQGTLLRGIKLQQLYRNLPGPCPRSRGDGGDNVVPSFPRHAWQCYQRAPILRVVHHRNPIKLTAKTVYTERGDLSAA